MFYFLQTEGNGFDIFKNGSKSINFDIWDKALLKVKSLTVQQPFKING